MTARMFIMRNSLVTVRLSPTCLRFVFISSQGLMSHCDASIITRSLFTAELRLFPGDSQLPGQPRSSKAIAELRRIYGVLEWREPPRSRPFRSGEVLWQ